MTTVRKCDFELRSARGSTFIWRCRVCHTVVEADSEPQRNCVNVINTRCSMHDEPIPCPTCEITRLQEEAQREVDKLEEQKRRAYIALINSTNIPAFAEQERERLVAEARIQPSEKCIHGHYLYQFYCNVCSWERVDPSYNLETYRHEINTAFQKTKAKYTLTGDPRLEQFGVVDAGREYFKDLGQIVDIEIWRATKKYGDQMNGALAYQIAYNQVKRFLKDLLDDQTVEVLDTGGKPVLNEYDKPLRQPRFESFDEKVENAEGEQSEISPAEQKIHRQQVEEESGARDWLDAVTAKRPLLEREVRSWHGNKRKVGEAILKNPSVTVRDIPGIPKSTVERIRTAILQRFKELVRS